jgi:hypothetical protein
MCRVGLFIHESTFERQASGSQDNGHQISAKGLRRLNRSQQRENGEGTLIEQKQSELIRSVFSVSSCKRIADPGICQVFPDARFRSRMQPFGLKIVE